MGRFFCLLLLITMGFISSLSATSLNAELRAVSFEIENICEEGANGFVVTGRDTIHLPSGCGNPGDYEEWVDYYLYIEDEETKAYVCTFWKEGMKVSVLLNGHPHGEGDGFIPDADNKRLYPMSYSGSYYFNDHPDG